MTRDEAFKLAMQACKETWNEKTCAEIMKALEQEPCGDCISRQAALEKAVYTETEEGWSGMTVDVKDIETLPPVTSQQKIGHWKFVQRGKYIDICCSNCGYQRVKEYAYNYTVDQISEQDIKDLFSNTNMNFCENCGAKMVEPQAESEEV